MKGFNFRKRPPLALWKVLMIVFASLIGIAGVTALVLFLTGRFDEDHIDPTDMAFTQTVDGEGYADNIGGNNWYFLSDDSSITISCTTENVTETRVTLSLRNGHADANRTGYITDGVITIPSEVQLNESFKIELVRRNNQIVGSTTGFFSQITAKSQNIMLPTKTAYVAVDSPVTGIKLAVGGNEAPSDEDEVQNVVVGAKFNINTIFTPDRAKYMFNQTDQTKRIFFRVLGSNGVNFISYTQNPDGTYTFSADEISEGEYATVYAYAFANSYFEYDYFAQNPTASAEEVLAFMQNEDNATQVVSARTYIKVLDIKVDRVTVEPSLDLAEMYVDKFFTISTNSTTNPNDMSLGVSIFDSNSLPAQALLSRVGIKVPKDVAGLAISGGRVMKVTKVDGEVVSIEEGVFDPDFDYADVAANVEYYILPRTNSTGDYANYYWSLSSDTAHLAQFDLEINFFYKDEAGQWTMFFKEHTQTLGAVIKEGDNSVSLPEDSIDLVINFDDEGKPIPASVTLSSDTGDSIYTKVVYFLFDNTRDGAPVNMQEAFICGSGVDYTEDYKHQPINISGIATSPSYKFYELPANNILTANKSFAGSVVVVAALVRTNASGEIQYLDDQKTQYQIVCFSAAKTINVESTLSISNMSPTFSFVGEVKNVDGKAYLPAINRNEDGSQRAVLSFTLKLTSEDLLRDIEKLVDAYNSKTLQLVVCDDYGIPYKDQYLTLSSLAEDREQRTDNLATFIGEIKINEEYFSAGRTTVDQGRKISFKITYTNGRETREKLVGQDTPADDGVVDYFYVYYQQPTTLQAAYQSRPEISVAEKIEVNISSGDGGLKIKWGNTTLTGATYEDIIGQLNALLTFTIIDQFGNEISPNDGIYSVQFTEVRQDSNYVLIFNNTNGIATSVSDFGSTDGAVVPTDLRVFVVDRKNGNAKVPAANPDGTILEDDLQSDLIHFEVSTEGLDHIEYDNTTEVGNSEDDRFVDAAKGANQVTVSKTVKANDSIRIADLFKVYTTGTDAPNTDYTITFDGTWIQGFKGGTRGVDLKRMLQINAEGSEDAKESIVDYENTPIESLTINAPFGEEATLQFSISSTNNLYRVVLNLVLSSDIEIRRSFENYQTKYGNYLSKTEGGPISVFADEYYNLDEYLRFNGEFSWADALIGKGVDLSSNVNGVFYEATGTASLDILNGEGVGGRQVRLRIAGVRQYTTISITLYYGVKSDFAFNTQIALYVNPNIVILEHSSSVDEYPKLDLTTLTTKNVGDFYTICKATSYIDSGAQEPVTLGDEGQLDIKNLNYTNKAEDGFIIIQNSSAGDSAGKFAFVAGKSVDILNSYSQEFSIFTTGRSVLDAVKVRVVDGGENKIFTYTDKEHISIGFSVVYDNAGVDELIQSIFPEATVVNYKGEKRLLVLAGKQYAPSGKFAITEVTGTYLTKMTNGSLNVRSSVPFVDHDNAVKVYSTVGDGTTTLQINIDLDVTVSNVGKEFVYYSNEKGLFATYKDVDFDKLVSADYNDLIENDVYETLAAGQEYKVLHDIAKEYTKTTDEEIVPTKQYYRQTSTGVGEGTTFTLVDTPKAEELESYYEKNAPEHGFYYDSELIAANGDGGRTFTAEIVTDADGYIENLATYENGKLKINSMEKDLAGFIILKFTIAKTGSSSASYSWYYRIKVAPNFTRGNVNYPYNDGGEDVFGEYLDISSPYYTSETMTYTIALEEQFVASNSGRHGGKRFDDIAWDTKPAGTIVEGYRTVSVTEGVSVSYGAGTINITYTSADTVNTQQTVIIEKYWSVDNVEVVGSAMQYVFKLNQGSQYSISLYRNEVKDSNKIGADNQSEYQEGIVAGSGEKTFIPTISKVDGDVAGGAEEFGSYIKGDIYELFDALQFKKVWLVSGTHLKQEEGEDIVLEEDTTLVESEAWTSAEVAEADGNVTITFAEGMSIKTLTKSKTDGYLWTEVSGALVGADTEKVNIGIKEEDLIVEFLADGLQEYRTTDDKTKLAGKTYYTFADGEYVEAELENGASLTGNTYYEKYRNPYKTVTLNTKASISKDSKFELGFYTDEGVVVKVALSAKSFFTWNVEKEEVDSGATYSFADLISGLALTKEESTRRQINEITLRLNNGTDTYREYYFVTSDKTKVATKTYYTLVDGKYVEATVETSAPLEAGVYYEKTKLTINDVVELKGTATKPEGSDITTSAITLEIAPLVEDISLDMSVSIKSALKEKAEENTTYTFSLPLNVKATFDETTQRQVQDMDWRYGQIAFNVAVKNNETSAVVAPQTYSQAPTPVTLRASTNTTYHFLAGDGYSLVDDTEAEVPTTPTISTILSILPEDVSEETQGVVKTINIVGQFKDKEISRFVVRYRYSIAKNVIVTTNYPTPDGVEKNEDGSSNSSTTEYISATTALTGAVGQTVSADYMDFFNSSATFAMEAGREGETIKYKTRIETHFANRVANGQYEQRNVPEHFKYNWSVSVSNISNLELRYTTGSTSLSSIGAGTITRDSVNRVIIENVEDDTSVTTDDNNKKVNFRFTLLNTASAGTVTFDVRINNVLIQYSVTVVNAAIVKVSTNTPNYNMNRETVYAEDLAQSEELELFKEGRLLNYMFRSSAVVGTEYFVRLANRDNPADNKIVPITVEDREVSVNIDLGKSYAGYDYAATFHTLVGAQNNDEGDKLTDESVFTIAPNLTSRIVVTYYDGKRIKLDATNYIILNRGLADEKANAVKLTTSDYHRERKFKISVQVGTTKITTDWYYNLYLEVEFDVSENADYSTNYTTKTIYAGSDDLSLFDDIDFGVYNTRTGNKYSNSGKPKTDSFATVGGSVALGVYGTRDNGFAIDSTAGDLSFTAWQIHQKLQSTVTDGIKFATGIIPRANATLDGGYVGGSAENDYITISALTDPSIEKGGYGTGKNVDFAIRARGASNDGNHVMLRLTYTVSFGEDIDPIKVEHNILLKVMPASSVKFLTRQGSTATTASANEIIDYASVASNKESPFAITNDDDSTTNKFYLWTKETGQESAIQAFLYGNTTLNNANTFVYSYKKESDTSEYNNWKKESSGGAGWVVLERNGLSVDVNAQSQQVELSELKLGARKFYITAKNNFGFQMRFYFTLTATENPQIARMDTTVLTEGTSVVVGSQYTPTSPTITQAQVGSENEFRQLLGTIIYSNKGGETGKGIANTISNVPANITKIVLMAQTNTGFGVVTKTPKLTEQKTDGVVTSKSFNIWDGARNDEKAGGWELNGQPAEIQIPKAEGEGTEPKKLEQDGTYGLLGSIISIYGVFSNDDGHLGTFTNLIYDEAGPAENDRFTSKPIEQTYSTTGGPSEFSLQDGDTANSDKVRVILRGISSYAFDSTGNDAIHSLNTDTAKSFVSRVNDIEVTDIKFYYGDGEIGVAYRGANTAANAPLPLITNSDYYFWSGNSSGQHYRRATGEYNKDTQYYKYDNGSYTEVTDHPEEVPKDYNTYYTLESPGALTQGYGYKTGEYDFVVPVFESKLFKDSDLLQNVRMEISLKQGDNNCTLSQYVNISRWATYKGFDGANALNIQDNTAVAKPTTTTQELYNDTLEVVLDANESVTFAISENELSAVPTEGLITLTNSANYTVTRYVGISANMADLSVNYDGTNGGTFNILVVSQTTEDQIDFKYSGSSIAVDTIKTPLNKYNVVSDIATIIANKEYYVGDAKTKKKGSELLTSAAFSETTDTYILADSGDVYTRVASASQAAGKTCYVINSTYRGQTWYELAYKLTTDKTIVDGRSYYTRSTLGLYERVTTPKIDDLATYYVQDVATKYRQKTIRIYSSNITLHINDVSELNGDSKAETLYFLFKGGNSQPVNGKNLTNTDRTYQMKQTFSVYPVYENITSDYTDTSGNIEFTVDQFLRVYSDSEFYYVIPRASWGQKIKLNKFAALGGEAVTDKSVKLADNPMLIYEINKETSGGAGGAFIDESGLIVTDKNFSLLDNTITVNIYMKVSGQNGFFDVQTTRRKLGSFRMMLSGAASEKAHIKESGTDVSGPKVGYLSNNGDFNGVLAIPDGFKVRYYATSGDSTSTGGWSYTTESTPDENSKTIACEVGDIVDFTEVFADVDKGHHMTYHIVKDNYGGADHIVYYSNLDTYKFDVEGTHVITLSRVYKSGTTYTHALRKVTVMVYNVLNREDKVILLNQGESYKLSTGASDSWYELDEEGTVTAVANKQFVAPTDKTGVFYKTYISLIGGTTKVNSFTFWVVEANPQSRSVVINQGAPYRLSNLYDTSGYRFYKVTNGDFASGTEHADGINMIETEYISQAANGKATVQYIVADPEKNYSKLSVTFFVTNSTSPQEAMLFIETGTSLRSAIVTQVGQQLSTSLGQAATVTNVETIGENSTLTSLAAGTNAGTDLRIDATSYLITYTINVNGRTQTRYARYNIGFYVYKGEKNVEIKTAATQSYKLLNGATEILAALNVGTDKEPTLEFLQLSGIRLVPVSDISLGTLDDAEGGIKATYMVAVSYNSGASRVTEYYLVNITFKANT